MTRRALTALLIAVSCVALPATVSAHETADSNCSGEERAVLGDRADWAAVELIGWAIGTKCLLDSGDRESDDLPAATVEIYDDQRVIVVGGTAAVPDAKLIGLDIEDRLWGRDRLETMRVIVWWVGQEMNNDDGIGRRSVESGTGPQAGRLVTLPCGIHRVTLEVSNNGDTEPGADVVLTVRAAESDYFVLLVDDTARQGRWERNVRMCPGEDGVSEPIYFEFQVDQDARWTFTLEELIS